MKINLTQLMILFTALLAGYCLGGIQGLGIASASVCCLFFIANMAS